MVQTPMVSRFAANGRKPQRLRGSPRCPANPRPRLARRLAARSRSRRSLASARGRLAGALVGSRALRASRRANTRDVGRLRAPVVPASGTGRILAGQPHRAGFARLPIGSRRPALRPRFPLRSALGPSVEAFGSFDLRSRPGDRQREAQPLGHEGVRGSGVTARDRLPDAHGQRGELVGGVVHRYAALRSRSSAGVRVHHNATRSARSRGRRCSQRCRRCSSR